MLPDNLDLPTIHDYRLSRSRAASMDCASLMPLRYWNTRRAMFV
jgi:hypothetical protein